MGLLLRSSSLRGRIEIEMAGVGGSLIHLKDRASGAAVDSLILSFVKIVTTASGIVCTMILSRTLSLVEYGTYSQGNLVISLVSSMTVLGLTDASNFFFNRPEFGRPYISNILYIEVVIGSIAAIAIVVFKEQVGAYFSNDAVASLAVFLALRPLLSNALATLQVVIISLGKSKMLAARNLVVSIIKVIVVCFVGFIYKNLAIIFFAYLLIDALNVLWFFIIYVRDVGRPRIGDFDATAIRTILRFSLPLAVSVFVSAYSRQMSNLIVGAFKSTEEYAIFSNCSAQLPLDFISASFMTVLMPILTRSIAERNEEDARGVYSDYLQIGYMLVWPFAACLAVVSPECVALLYGEKYITGVPIFTIYLLTYATTFFSSTLVLTAGGRTRAVMGVAILSLVANGAFCYLACRFAGIFGVAVASVAVNFVTAIVILRASCRFLGGNMLDLVAAAKMGGYLALLFILAVPIFCLRRALISINVPNLAIIFVASTVYLGTFYILKRKDLYLLLGRINHLK